MKGRHGEKSGGGGVIAYDWRQDPMVIGLGGWIAGTLLAAEAPQLRTAAVCIVLIAGSLATGLVAWRSHPVSPRRWRWAGLAVLLAAVAWYPVGVPGNEATNLRHQLDGADDSRLVDVEGVIVDDPHLRLTPSGELGEYSYQPATTGFTLALDRARGPAGAFPVTGSVLVKLAHVDQRWLRGQRVRCRGWLSDLEGPSNPGQSDYERRMARRGVVGVLWLKTPGNITRLDAGLAGELSLEAWRQRLRSAAQGALRHGMSRGGDAEARALLEAILLGHRGVGLREIGPAFRRTGLAHLLSISGLHVGVLALGAWWLVGAGLGRPRWAGLVAILAVVVYMLVVPPRAPIVRAGLMTIAVLAGVMTGRRAATLSLLAAVAWGWLVWLPNDLFEAGFQLSFGIVAALVVFVPRVSRWIVPEPLEWTDEQLAAAPFGRRFWADYLAVCLVAWLLALPMVAYHFNVISTVAVALSLLMLPVAMGLLWLGFLKIAMTLLWPAAGALFAGPLTALAEMCVAMVRIADGMPAAHLDAPPPSPVWALATAGVVLAIFTGRFARRPWPLAAAVLLCAGWLFGPTLATRSGDAVATLVDHRPPLRLNMFAVGDGSCFLLRTPRRTLVFDCGSNNQPDITTVCIGPALRRMGVTHVDVLMLSHPDLDHYSGSPELIDGFGVKRLVVTPRFAGKADASPYGGARHLLDFARRRGVAIEIAAAGWQRDWDEANLSLLWPPADAEFRHDNDHSAVLAIEAAGRRVLLCGDVQQDAITAMLDGGLDLAADVTDLPHHGSFVDASPSWLARVDPRIVLQSSGRARLRRDKWPPHLVGVERYITARHGMVALVVQRDGTIEVRSFRDASGPSNLQD